MFDAEDIHAGFREKDRADRRRSGSRRNRFSCNERAASQLFRSLAPPQGIGLLTPGQEK